MPEALTIDGSQGEGGGQILRSALALSVALARPVRITKIRAGRERPGLLRQHLAAVRAAAAVSGGECTGAELGSVEVTLQPGAVRAGEYAFAVGSAGSALLVLQTVLPPLLLCDGPSTVVVEGGTHNPLAPPFEFLERAFAPRLAELGAGLELELLRPGFHPAGGGRVRARILPGRPRAFELLERGTPLAHGAEIGVAHLPRSILERERETLVRELGWPADAIVERDVNTSLGPGNYLALTLAFEHVTEVVTGFGERRRSAEAVAHQAAAAARGYLAADAPVGEHLADQLLVPLALLAGGRFRTLAPTPHTRTNAELVNRFLPGAVHLERRAEQDWLATVAGRRARS